MSHGSPEGMHVQERAREWWGLAALAIVGAGFGAYGQWHYEIDNGLIPDPWSVAYHTLQLFILHAPHLDGRIPWTLHAGRWLTAAAALWAVVRALGAIFRTEWQLFLAHRRRGHIVVCGLGRLGMQLGREFHRQGKSIVAIESNPSAAQLALAQRAGVALIPGDACSLTTLRRAAVERATKVIAVCDDEQKNVAIAARVGELIKGKPLPEPLECWMFISDPRLREIFRADGLFPHTSGSYSVNVRGLDLFEVAARQILRRAPLDYDRIKPGAQTMVHLMIIGFGSMGRHLAAQAAKIGHFANFQKLKITVLERQGTRRVEEFLARHTKFQDVCDFTFAPLSLPEDRINPETIVGSLPPLDQHNELITVAVCWDSSDANEDTDFFKRLEHDDGANLGLALELAKNPATTPQVFVFQTREAGFAALFPLKGRGRRIGPRMHAFGMLEESYSIEALLHENEDEIAKVLHKDWYDKQKKKGLEDGDRPALFPWEQVAERFKDSNRRAADHIWVKMRALGYYVEKVPHDKALVPGFDKDQIELLAKMEHESWNAEWLLHNYSYAPGERNDEAKTQPYLVPWDRLDKSVQDWDRSQVEAIPAALEKAGYGIYV